MPLVKKPLTPQPAAKPDMVTAALTLQRGTVTERWDAVRAMAGEAAAVPLLAAALHGEAEPQLREAMFTALARIGTAESFIAVLQYLRSDDAATRTAALDAMKLMPEQAGARLDGLLRDDDADIRVLVCELARVVPDGEAALTALLARETSVNVCGAAVEMLAEIGGPASLAALRDCAARFPGVVFLQFSIRLAAGQIAARDAPPSA
jgi:hydrogenase maturation factor